MIFYSNLNETHSLLYLIWIPSLMHIQFYYASGTYKFSVLYNIKKTITENFSEL